MWREARATGNGRATKAERIVHGVARPHAEAEGRHRDARAAHSNGIFEQHAHVDGVAPVTNVLVERLAIFGSLAAHLDEGRNQCSLMRDALSAH